MTDPALRLLAVDPGSAHCGMAEFLGLRCYHAYEVGPEECVDIVEQSLIQKSLDVLVVEEYRLYASKAQEQIGSKIGTTEVIGQLRWLHRRYGDGVVWAEQAASIKKPIANILRAKKIASEAKRTKAGGHALDAELHGWARLLRQENE